MAETFEPALHRGRRPVVGAALVLGAAALWATFGIFAKVLYDAGFAPVELASVRAAVGFAIVALLALPRALRAVRVPIRALPFFAAYGIFGLALFELAFFAALERTTVAIAAALLYTAPAFVVMLSAILWHERFDRARMLSLVVMLGGVLLVTGAAGALLRGTASLPAAALLFGLGSGVFYALYTLFSKVATERYGPFASLFWSFGVATAALAALASPIAPFMRSPEHAPMLIALGVIPTVLPYALYLAALRELRASTAAMLASVEPAVAAVLAVVLLHESMDALQIAGMALVVSAAALLAREASTAGE